MGKGTKRKHSSKGKAKASGPRPKAPRTAQSTRARSDSESDIVQSPPAASSTRRRAYVEDVEDKDDASVASVEVVGSNIEPVESAQAELTRLQSRWTAAVYAFFRPEVEIIENRQGRRAHVFRCAGATCTKTITRYLDTSDATSTTNLRNHIKKCTCWGEEILEQAEGMTASEARACISNVPRAGSIVAAFRRQGKDIVTFSTRQHTRSEARAEIVRWVSESKRPFEVVKDCGFVKLMETGRPSYYIPSPSTVSRDVKRVLANVRRKIAKMLHDHPGRINFATDAWTSPNHRAFVAITVHLSHKGKPLSFPLDLVEVADSHTSDVLSEAFVGVLAEFLIKEKLLSVTTDNASPMDTMIAGIAIRISSFPGEPAHGWCFDHILHLTGKSFLRPFDVGSEKDIRNAHDATEASLAELAKGLDLEESEMEKLGLNNFDENGDEGAGDVDNDDVNGKFDETVDLTREEREELDEIVRPVKFIPVKLRKLSFSIINSSTILLPAWHDVVKRHKLSDRHMPRDVRTWWKSTFTMLDFAIKYKDPIMEFTSDRKLNMRRYELDDKEWVLVEQLRDVLKVLYDGTQFFSRNAPSISEVLPAMDVVDETLTDASINMDYQPAIRAAANLAKKTINRYYSKFNTSEVYRITMILDPNHKLSYFETAGWSQEWIDTAVTIAKEEFERNYAFIGVNEDDSILDTNDGRSVSSTLEPVNLFDRIRQKQHAAATRRQSQQARRTNEFDRFLKAPVEAVEDVIKWWYEHQSEYPRLSRMALDFLTIPATSVAVERVFSQGRILLSHVRNRLSSQSVRALLCLGEWSKLGLVADEDVLKVTEEPEEEGSETLADVMDGWDRIIN